MHDALTSVKQRRAFYARMRDRVAGQDDAQSRRDHPRFAELVIDFDAIIEEIEELRAKTKPLPTTLGDLSDIPAELLAELSSIKTDELEDQLVTLINAYGGTADLDQILVGLYRRYHEVYKRRYVQNKLWRMVPKGLVWAVPHKKGLYTTSKIEDADEDNSKTGRLNGRTGLTPPGPVDDLDEDIPF